MSRSIIAAILLFSTPVLIAKDAPIHLPENPTSEQDQEFWRQMTERRQRNLVSELEEIAAHDPQVTLYTTETKPDPLWVEDGKTEWVDVFRDYPIIGKAEITNREDRNALLQALIRGMRESDGASAPCFQPRHALTITTKEKKIDILVCFHCFGGQVWGAYGAHEFVTTTSPMIEFNKIADKYKLPVAK